MIQTAKIVGGVAVRTAVWLGLGYVMGVGYEHGKRNTRAGFKKKSKKRSR